MRTQREQGFTLLELLVVVVIMGVLVAIMIPNFAKQRSYADDVSLVGEANTATLNIQAFGNKPSSLTRYPDKLSSPGMKVQARESKMAIVKDASESTICLLAYSPNSEKYTKASPYTIVNNMPTDDGETCPLPVGDAVWE